MEYLGKVLGRKPAGQLQGMDGGGLKESSKGLQGGTGFAEQTVGQRATKGFSQTMQMDDPRRKKMREEYGYKMDDAEFQRNQGIEKANKEGIDDYKGRFGTSLADWQATTQGAIDTDRESYNTAKATYDAGVIKDQGTLDDAKAKLGKAPTMNNMFSDWYKEESKNMVNVQVVSNGQVEGSYQAPASIVQNWKMNNPELKGMFSEDGKYFQVDVKQGGRTQGKEMHMAAWGMSDKGELLKAFSSDEKVQESQVTNFGIWNEANTKLSGAYDTFNTMKNQGATDLSQWNTNIGISEGNLETGITSAGITRDTEIGKVTTGRDAQIEAARNAYRERAKARRSAYAGLSKMEYK